MNAAAVRAGIRWFPWMVVVLLAAGIAIGFSDAVPFPQDDHFHYQRFVETLAVGKLDLTILGFHGSDILAVPLYWLTRSPIAQIYFQIFCAILLPLFAFLAGRALYRSTAHGIMLACIIAMMPFLSFVALRGWTGPAYMCLMLLTVYGAASGARWTWIPWALAMLTKPFALALLPLVLLFVPKQGNTFRRYEQVLLAFAVVALYMIVQYAQAGHLLVGAHSGINQTNVWQGPVRIVLNAAHALQILFSVHNYYYPDPALTGPGNMMHTTPLLVFLGLFFLLQPTGDPPERRLKRALLIGAALGIAMNFPLDHMDHFYMQAGILLLILAALPMLQRFPLWIPLVLATLHFQWLYFFLQYGDPFQMGPWFFAVPVVVDLLFLGWCVARWRPAWDRVRAALVTRD